MERDTSPQRRSIDKAGIGTGVLRSLFVVVAIVTILALMYGKPGEPVMDKIIGIAMMTFLSIFAPFLSVSESVLTILPTAIVIGLIVWMIRTDPFPAHRVILGSAITFLWFIYGYGCFMFALAT